MALESHGKCAKHFHEVKLGARGAAGPSDVYVATGGIDLQPAAPAVAKAAHERRGTPSLLEPLLRLSLPAGSYLVTWRADFRLTASSGGGPAGQDYSVYLECTPEWNSAAHKGFGQPASEFVALTPDGYDAGNDTTSFDLRSSLTDFWALKVPSGGAKITMECSEPLLTDEFGGNADADSFSASGQIEATKVAKLHGFDDVA